MNTYEHDGSVEEVPFAGRLWTADYTAKVQYDPEEAQTRDYPGCSAQVTDVLVLDLRGVADYDRDGHIPEAEWPEGLRAALLAACVADAERDFTDGDHGGPDEPDWDFERERREEKGND